MAHVSFHPFTADDFTAFLKVSTVTYAREIAKARGLSRAEALTRSKVEFKQLLPKGRATPDNCLWTLIADEPRPVGTLWIALSGAGTRRRAFIYDIRIHPRYQGLGYGRATMQALERWARQNKVKQIGLNVFTHNARAHALYKSCGYQERSVQMAKIL